MKNKILLIIALPALLFCAYSISAQVSYRTSDDAQAAAQSALNRVRENERCVARIVERNNENNEQQVALARKIGDLIEEKKVALEEFRQGWFCSKCKRSKSEIEKAEGISFEDHLKKVNGEPVPATQQQISEKSEEFNRKISDLELQRGQLKKRYDELSKEGIGCYADQERARYDYFVATTWSQLMADGRLPDMRIKGPTELDANRFGLGKNPVVSPYGVLRAYPKHGQPFTVASDFKPDPAKIQKVKPHLGIDFSSRESMSGQPKPLPFTAGFSGTIHFIPNSATNTVDLILDNGNRIQFMHGTDFQVREGQRVGPDELIGFTGRVGADATHLHVGARNAAGVQIDPAQAVIGIQDVYEYIYEPAYEKASREQSTFPQLTWTEVNNASSNASTSTDAEDERRAAERSREYERQRRANGGSSNRSPQTNTEVVRKSGESDEDFRARQRAAEYEKQKRPKPPLL